LIPHIFFEDEKSSILEELLSICRMFSPAGGGWGGGMIYKFNKSPKIPPPSPLQRGR